VVAGAESFRICAYGIVSLVELAGHWHCFFLRLKRNYLSVG